MVDSDLLPPGTVLGRYAIVRRIGAGGMGAVYEAMHADLKKRVAIKILHPATAPDPEARLRFLREGEAASKIRHPHVVDIYDVGSENGIVYLVMEYLEGEDLGRVLHRERCLSPKRIAEILLPVSAAILAAHEEGVVHRDLKPANIFLARDRQGGVVPKILDFGISKLLHDPKGQGLTSSGTLLGTPYYMSPEQAHGNRALTAASDQYSLGVILYQAATGQRPFESESMYQVLHSIVEGRFLPPRHVRPELSEGFEAIILRAMKNDPGDRFPTMREVGGALLPYASDRARALWGAVFEPGSSALVSQDLPETLSSGGVAGVPLVEDVPYPSAAYSEPIKSAGFVSSTQNQVLSPSTGLVLLLDGRRSKRLVAAGISMLLAAALVLGILAIQRRRAADRAASAVSTPLEVEVPAKAIAATREQGERPEEKAERTPPYHVSLTVVPKGAKVELDGAEAEHQGHLERDLDRDGRQHTLRVAAEGYEPVTIVFRDSPPPERVELLPLPKDPATTPAGARSLRRGRPARTGSHPRESPKTDPSTPEIGANDAPIIR